MNFSGSHYLCIHTASIHFSDSNMSTRQSSHMKKAATVLVPEAASLVPGHTVKKVLAEEVVIAVTVDQAFEKNQATDDGAMLILEFKVLQPTVLCLPN